MTTFEIFLFMFINGYIMQWWSEIRLLIFYDVSSYYGSADTIDNNEKLHDILLIYNHIQTYVFNKYNMDQVFQKTIKSHFKNKSKDIFLLQHVCVYTYSIFKDITNYINENIYICYNIGLLRVMNNLRFITFLEKCENYTIFLCLSLKAFVCN